MLTPPPGRGLLTGKRVVVTAAAGPGLVLPWRSDA